VLPEKQANPQKTFERPPEKKLHRKTVGHPHDSIYERPPFSRTGLKDPPQKSRTIPTPLKHCLKDLEQNQSRTDTTGEPGKKRLNPKNTLTLHPKCP